MFVQLKDYPDYAVTDEGEVISLVYRQGSSGTRRPRWKLLKPKLSHGYWAVNLYKGGKSRTKTVHILVMAAFTGPRPAGLDINHKDGNKLNNHHSNLEYCSHAKNIQHAFDNGLCETIREAARQTGLKNKGEGNGRARLSDAAAAQLLALKGTMLQREAASIFGISWQYVGDIWSGRRRKHLQEAISIAKAGAK